MIFNKGGRCIGNQQGANKYLTVYKYIGINFQAVKYNIFCDIKEGWGFIAAEQGANKWLAV